MEPNGGPSVAFDATPLSVPETDIGGHMLRGIGRYIASLLDALATETTGWARDHVRPVVTRDEAVAPGMTPILSRRPAWRRQDFGPWLAWAADMAALRSQPVNLWHGLDPNAPLSPLPARRTVVTAYDLIPLHDPAALAQIRPHRRVTYRLHVRSLRRAALVLAISEYTAADVHSMLGVPRQRIRVVYPAIRHLDAAGGAVPAFGSALKAESRPDDPPDLLFVGVPDPTKQPELAIAALAECRRRGHDVRLRFAGYQRPADRDRLDAAAAANGVGDRVEHLGRIDDARLREMYRTSVLLAVSRIEGFGLPPAEAVLVGGRVVCGSAPVYREVLGTAAQYAARDDPAAIADAYEAAAATTVPNPPPGFADRFSPAATAGALIDAYRSLLD